MGTEISPGDLELHRAMAEWNESPIYMLLVRDSIWMGHTISINLDCDIHIHIQTLHLQNPAGSAETSKELPLQLYESELHVVNEVPTMLFVAVPFQLEAAEVRHVPWVLCCAPLSRSPVSKRNQQKHKIKQQAERISVEHVVKATPAEYGAGGLATSVDLHVDAVKASLAALVSRLRTVLRCVRLHRPARGGYMVLFKTASHPHPHNPRKNRALEAMQAGAVEPDHKLLRQIGTLCHLLPAAGRGNGHADDGGINDEFARAFLGEYSDGLLVTYLAAVSKLTSLAQEATGKFAFAFADAGAGGGGGGGGGGWHPHSHHPHASSGPTSHRAQGGAAGGGRSRR